MVWMIVEVVLMNVNSNFRFCDGLDDGRDGSDEGLYSNIRFCDGLNDCGGGSDGRFIF